MRTKAPILLCVLLATLTIISSCKKDDTGSDPNGDSACTGCEKVVALPENDSLQTGIYKGLLLTGNGVGHFRVNLKNGDNQTFMVMKFTRDTYPVLNDSLYPVGSLFLNGGSDLFVDFLGGGSRTEFYVNPVGASESIGDFTLSGSIGTGPKPQATVLKERSNEQVKVFEGTMQEATASGPNGKVGFVVRGNRIEGIITSSTNALRERFMNGTLDGSKSFSFSFSGNNSVYTGQMTSDTEISGSYTLNGTAGGTFTAKRTL